MYDIYLHICRLVLNVYNFTMLTVFYIKIYVFLYQIVQPFQDHCSELIDPNNLPKQNFKCCRYTRLYPVHLLTNCTTF